MDLDDLIRQKPSSSSREFLVNQLGKSLVLINDESL